MKLFAPHNKRIAGFTLIELMVSVGVFAVVTSIVFVRNQQFDNEVLLQSLSYDVALSVRETQNFGVNVRGSEGEFDNGYGVHFTAGTSTYETFVDRDNDRQYDGVGELLERFTMGRGIIVDHICDETANSCDVSPTFIDEVSVVFERPDPDAIINNGAISSTRVVLVAPRGGERHITVYTTGQIAITNPTATP